MPSTTAAPTASPTAGTPAPTLPERPELLDALDEALVAIRRVLQRPGYRRRMLEGLSDPVPLGVLRLLRVVQRASEAPAIGAVADVLAIDPSTASRVVERAVASGHLERRPCTDDRRRARLVLSVEGREILDQLTRRRRELLREITADWAEDELDHAVTLLERLEAGFDRLESAR